MNTKKMIFDFVVRHKTDCYRAFKICADHKGFNTKEGSFLIERARAELSYSKKTWDGDIYFALWRMYKTITIDGYCLPDKKEKPWTGVVKSRKVMVPTVGRIVNFKLSQQNVDEITRRRTTNQSIAERITEGKWPLGAQAHIGNPVEKGQVVPMIITAVWSDSCVNGKVILDGSDSYWVTSVLQGDQEFNWQWPERV